MADELRQPVRVALDRDRPPRANSPLPQHATPEQVELLLGEAAEPSGRRSSPDIPTCTTRPAGDDQLDGGPHGGRHAGRVDHDRRAVSAPRRAHKRPHRPRVVHGTVSAPSARASSKPVLERVDDEHASRRGPARRREATGRSALRPARRRARRPRPGRGARRASRSRSARRAPRRQGSRRRSGRRASSSATHSSSCSPPSSWMPIEAEVHTDVRRARCGTGSSGRTRVSGKSATVCPGRAPARQSGADRLDRRRDLVALDAREARAAGVLGQPALEEVEVGAADADRRRADEHLARARGSPGSGTSRTRIVPTASVTAAITAESCRTAVDDRRRAREVGVLERRAERDRRERRADALRSGASSSSKAAACTSRRDLGAEAAVRDRLVRDDEPCRCARPTRRSSRGRAGRACAGRSPRPRSRRRRAARRRASASSTIARQRDDRDVAALAQRSRASPIGTGPRSVGHLLRAEVERLVLDEDDRVRVGDRAREQPRRVGGAARHHDLQPGHVRQPALEALRVLRPAALPGAALRPQRRAARSAGRRT